MDHLRICRPPTVQLLVRVQETNVVNQVLVTIVVEYSRLGREPRTSRLLSSCPSFKPKHNNYCKNLIHHKGLLHSNQQLHSGGSTDAQMVHLDFIVSITSNPHLEVRFNFVIISPVKLKVGQVIQENWAIATVWHHFLQTIYYQQPL